MKDIYSREGVVTTYVDGKMIKASWDTLTNKEALYGSCKQQLAEIEKGEITYDLLLSDIVMPGIDGVELSNKATKIHPKLKVMFITGFAAVAMGRDDIDKEKAQILSKPFHLNDLVKQVETMLSA